MTRSLYALAYASLLLHGAIFGFFYAWVCSTMWGLDAIDPNTAIAAMNGMNASVRNAVFAPAFFATPLVSWLTAFVAFRAGCGRAALGFAIAGFVYALGAQALTLAVNVPMNEALMQVDHTLPVAEAGEVWAQYSQRWQFYNVLRTLASGLALCCVGFALTRLRPVAAP